MAVKVLDGLFDGRQQRFGVGGLASAVEGIFERLEVGQEMLGAIVAGVFGPLAGEELLDLVAGGVFLAEVEAFCEVGLESEQGGAFPSIVLLGLFEGLACAVEGFLLDLFCGIGCA